MERDRVKGVRVADSIYRASSVMIATSVWGRSHLSRIGVFVPVYPHRAEMGFFHVPLGGSNQLNRILSDSQARLYMRPGGRRQIFVGWREGDLIQSPGDFSPEDPDHYQQTAHYDRLQQMRARLSEALTFMDQGFVYRSYACVYDYTPDGQPILDADGPHGLFYAIGFSGGGFSMAPCVGRAMARFIIDQAKPSEIEWLRRSRFEEGDLIQWSNTQQQPVRPPASDPP